MGAAGSKKASSEEPAPADAVASSEDNAENKQAPVEMPGKKTVEDLKAYNPEDYEDDTNQTGLSHYEIKIQESFYAAPERPRSKAYNAMKSAEQAKKAEKANKKAQRAARKKRKSKKKEEEVVLEKNTIPWVIENAKKVGILDLSKMTLDSVPDEVFEYVPGTTRIINLAFNKLTLVDPRLCDFVLVQRLIANGNLLTSLPDNIVRMTALKKLDLASNRLTSLPDAFEGMKFLEYVDLSDNELTELPPSFGSLHLTALNLSGNRFEQAPTCISSMEFLMDLNLQGNQLTQVPSVYAELTQLIGLNLEENRITDFPNEILASCTELVTLRLRRNPIRMPQLEAKPAYSDFVHRRDIKYRRQLNMGTVALSDLNPADE